MKTEIFDKIVNLVAETTELKKECIFMQDRGFSSSKMSICTLLRCEWNTHYIHSGVYEAEEADLYQ